jgi:hypothetical protein
MAAHVARRFAEVAPPILGCSDIGLEGESAVREELGRLVRVDAERQRRSPTPGTRAAAAAAAYDGDKNRRANRSEKSRRSDGRAVSSARKSALCSAVLLARPGRMGAR